MPGNFYFSDIHVSTVHRRRLPVGTWPWTCGVVSLTASARSDPISHPIISSSTSICYPFPVLSFRLFLNQPHSVETSHAPFCHHFFIILLCLVLPLGLYQQNKIHRQIHQLINSLSRHVSPIHSIAFFQLLIPPSSRICRTITDSLPSPLQINKSCPTLHNLTSPLPASCSLDLFELPSTSDYPSPMSTAFPAPAPLMSKMAALQRMTRKLSEERASHLAKEAVELSHSGDKVVRLLPHFCLILSTNSSTASVSKIERGRRPWP